MTNTFAYLAKTAWDGLNPLSAYRRNAAFLEKCGVSDYTHFQHAKYQEAMEELGLKPQSVPKTLYTERQNFYRSAQLGSTSSKQRSLEHMETAVNVLAQATGQDLVAAAEPALHCHPLFYKFTIQKEDHLVYSRTLKDDARSESENPWIRPMTRKVAMAA